MGLIEETKYSYYEYVSKISNGCQLIANYIREGNQAEALQMILDLAEGMSWLAGVEQSLKENNLTINSRMAEANEYLNEINNYLEIQDYVMVADLFEYELQPLFASASEWVFQNAKGR